MHTLYAVAGIVIVIFVGYFTVAKLLVRGERRWSQRNPDAAEKLAHDQHAQDIVDWAIWNKRTGKNI